MAIIKTTKIFTEVDNAIHSGYKVVSAQGSSRSSKTYNILIYLLSHILTNKKSLSIVRKTLPALKGSVFRDFKEIMQDKYKILYEKGVVSKLSSRFGVTEQTVRNALRFSTEGNQPDLIREVALKEYGCVLQKKQIQS